MIISIKFVHEDISIATSIQCTVFAMSWLCSGSSKITEVLAEGCSFELSCQRRKSSGPFAGRPNRSQVPAARRRCDVSALRRRYAAEMGPTTRYAFLRNTARIMNI